MNDENNVKLKRLEITLTAYITNTMRFVAEPCELEIAKRAQLNWLKLKVI